MVHDSPARLADAEHLEEVRLRLGAIKRNAEAAILGELDPTATFFGIVGLSHVAQLHLRAVSP